VNYGYVQRAFYKAGTNTAGYHNLKVKKHTLGTNAYVVTTTTRTPGSMSNSTSGWYSDGQTSTYLTQKSLGIALSPDPYNDPSISGRAYSGCVSAFNSKLKGITVNMAQAFGERNQVTNMLASTAVRLARGFSHLRKGRWSECAKTLGLSVKYVKNRSGKAINRFEYSRSKDAFGAAADLWLELQYGWRPLLNDIYESAELLAEQNVRRGNDTLHTAHSISAKNQVTDNKVIRTVDGNNIDVVNQQAAYVVRIKATYRVENDLLRFSNMLGLTNPALLAWELTPFSFVVDWFLPIGSFLENSMASTGLTFIKGSVSYKFIGQTSGFASSSSSGEGWAVSSRTNKGLTKTVMYQRDPSSSFPSEPIPSFKSPASIGHALNAIALLTQVFRR